MSDDWRDNKDWRISDAQFKMIVDKLPKLSKKEASLVIRFIVHVLLEGRQHQPENLQDNSQKIGTLEPSTQLGDP